MNSEKINLEEALKKILEDHPEIATCFDCKKGRYLFRYYDLDDDPVPSAVFACTNCSAENSQQITPRELAWGAMLAVTLPWGAIDNSNV